MGNRGILICKGTDFFTISQLYKLFLGNTDYLEKVSELMDSFISSMTFRRY